MEAQQCTVTPDLQKLYQLHFGCPLGDQDKEWAPHVICTPCSNGLHRLDEQMENGNALHYSHDVQEPKNHVDDCNFCFVSVTGFSAKNRHQIVYLNPTLE
jgi:hypothetical protein